MGTLYASRVPGALYGQVVISDSSGRIVARHPWYYKSKPDKRNKYINHNCNKYKLIWRD